jgi:two-component system response regulator MprA
MPDILLVEDEYSIADFVQRGLVISGFQVDHAVTALDAVSLITSRPYDLVILDLGLLDGDGIVLCSAIKQKSDAGIIMLTARGMVGDRVRGLEAGADDYIPKPFAFNELVARVRSVLRRRAPQTGQNIRVADLEIDLHTRSVKRGGAAIELTAKECDLLKLLAENAGRPLSREHILQRVWGWVPSDESDSVKVYISYLRSKLNRGTSADLITTIRGFGYVMKAPER